jgi:tetratricopeptide (TPR) repeat protein
MNCRRNAALRVLSATLLLATPMLDAHDSAEHTVISLTDDMMRYGVSAELLYKRALAYQELHDYHSAALDLQDALKRKADYIDAEIELARVYHLQGENDKALEAVNQSLGKHGRESAVALYGLRAQIHTALGKFAEALGDCEIVLATDPNSVDDYLRRSDLQGRLEKWDERAASLEQATKANSSAVLQVEWIEALIDCGKYEAALAKIEAQFKDVRLASAWRLRRALCLRGLGRKSAAAEDLIEALDELNSRIKIEHPEVTLLVERGLVEGLLNHVPAATLDYNRAKALKAAPALVRRLKNLVALSEQGTKMDDVSVSDLKKY